MAYGLKYYAESYGLASVQWKVELLYKDYVSTSTELSMVGDGIKIGHDKEDDRFNTIYSRYAIIDLKINETFNLDSVQFDDERQVQVKIYKDSVLEFIGWLIPFYSSEPFEDYSIATMSIMAKDGINQLKNKLFVDAHTDIVSNKQSKKDIISQALRELGYNINLEIYYNKYENGMDKTSSDCPLSQTYFNVTSFEKDDGTNINYYDVIYRLLISHDLRIGQLQGKWVIVSQIEQSDGSVSGRKFDYLGDYVSNVTLSNDITIHTGGLKVKSNSNIRKDIPIQQYTTIYEAGLLTNLLSNGKLNNYVGLDPVNWTKVGTWSIGQVSTILGSDGIQFDNTFTHSELANDDKYFESAPIDISGLGSFKFSAEAYADDDIDSVKIAIIIYKSDDVDAQKYYVDKYGSIKKYDVTAIIDKGVLNQHIEFGFPFDAGLPANNTFYIGLSDRLKIRIYPGVKLDSGATPTHKKVQYRNLVLSGTAKNYDKEFVGRKFQYTNTLLPNSKKADELTVYYQGQISGNVYDQSRFRNSLFVGDTSDYANLWKRTGEATNHSIIESVLIDRLSLTNKFGDIFEGSIKGYIHLFNTPVITADSKRFLVLHSEYTLQQDSSEVLLTELYISEITFEAKVFDKFSNDKLVDISDGTSSSSISTVETFDKPVTTTGGVVYDPILIDGGIDAIPLDSTDVRAKNKGHLGIGEQYADSITIGNHAYDTLTEVLGRLKLTNNDDFGANFSVADYTSDHDVIFPNRNIIVNDWNDINNKIEGTPNYLLKFSADPTSYEESQVFDNGTNVAIGGFSPLKKLDVLLAGSGVVDNEMRIGTQSSIDESYNGVGLNFVNNEDDEKSAYLVTYWNDVRYKNISLAINGNNGFGTDAPTEKIHVAGNILLNGKVGFNGDMDDSWIGSITNGIEYKPYSVGNFTFVSGSGAWNFTNGTVGFADTVTFNVIPICAVNATSANELVNYQTALALASGIKYDRNSVKTVAFTNIVLLLNQTISAYATSDGDRVLVAGNTDASENGVWITGTVWVRDTNFDTGSEILSTIHSVSDGDFAGYKYINSNVTAPLVGTDDIFYSEFSNLVETDPIFTASAAYAITGTDITHWNTAYAERMSVSDTDDLSEGSTNLYFTETRVLNTTLTGFTVGSNTPITAGNTVLTAFQNVMAMLNAKATTATGTANYLSKYTSASALANSQVFDDGTSVGINTSSPNASYKLHVNGSILATQGRFGSASVGINLVNHGGTAPRVASTGAMDFFATDYYWYTTGDLQQMRLTTTGLKIGSTGSASEKLSVDGNITLTGVIKNSGTAPTTGQFLSASSSSAMAWKSFTIDDITSIGADHTFIKSNGTTLEWSLMTVGDIDDIADNYLSLSDADEFYAKKIDAVMYGTFEGERGFKLYHDDIKEFDAALFFANADTGIVGIHAYGLDGATKTEHGIQIDEDGHVYHRKLDNTRVRFLTTDDSLTGGATFDGGLLRKPIEFRSATNASDTRAGIRFSYEAPSPFGAEIYLAYGHLPNGFNITSNHDTDIYIIAGIGNNDIVTDATKNLYMYGSDIFLSGQRIFINTKEIDMSGFAVGKVLTATSSSKAEWI